MPWKRILAATCLISAHVAVEAAPVVKARTIGTVELSRAAGSFRLQGVPEAGLAIIYDRQGRRCRVLTADGRLTDLARSPCGNTQFDQYLWDPVAKALLLRYGSGVARFDPASRQFADIGGDWKSIHPRSLTFVPRWGRVIVGTTKGLFYVEAGRILPVPSRGAAPGDVVRVQDMPRFRALLIETIDDELFLRTGDGVVRPLGRLAEESDTIQEARELRTRPALQLRAGRQAVDVSMARGPDGIWRPEATRWMTLAGTPQPLTNGFVESLDAFVVFKPMAWPLGWWFDRNGLFRVGPGGLEPIGTYSQQIGGDASLWAPPGHGPSYLRSVSHDPASTPVTYRFGGQRDLIADPSFAPAGRFVHPYAMAASGDLLLKGSDGVWLKKTGEAPRRIADMPWPSITRLPLGGGTVIASKQGAAIVRRDGRILRIRSGLFSGSIVQLTPDRIFVVSDKIVSVDAAGLF